MDRFKNMSNRIRRRTSQESGESSKQNEASYPSNPPPPLPMESMVQQFMAQCPYHSPQEHLPQAFAPVNTLGKGPETTSNAMHHHGPIPNKGSAYQFPQKISSGFPSASTQKNKETVGTQQNYVQWIDSTDSPSGDVLPALPSKPPQMPPFGNTVSSSGSQMSKFKPSKLLRRHKQGSSPRMNETPHPLQSYATPTPHGPHPLQSPGFVTPTYYPPAVKPTYYSPALKPTYYPPPVKSAVPSTAHASSSKSQQGMGGGGPSAQASSSKSQQGMGGGGPSTHYIPKNLPPELWPEELFHDAFPHGYHGGDDFLNEPYPSPDQEFSDYLAGGTPAEDMETVEEERTNDEGVILEEDSKSSTDENESSMDITQNEEDLSDEVLEEVRQIQEYAHRAVNVTCAACHKKVSLKASDVMKLTRSWCSSTGVIIIGLRCTGSFCNKHICAGCGMAITAEAIEEPRGTFQVSGIVFKAYWCCDAGKLAAIWALACGWKPPRNPKFAPVATMVEKVRHSSNHPACHIFGSGPSATAKGVGYGGERPDIMRRLPVHSRPNRYNPHKASPTGAKEDLVREAYFRLLTLLLSPRDGVTYNESLPLGLLCPMLSRSQLIEQAALMLSTNSIEETARKYHLYEAMLDFVELLGQNPLTSGLVYNKRNIYNERRGVLVKVSFARGVSKGGFAPKDTGRSLTILLESLASQAKGVVKYASTNTKELEGSDILTLSQRLISMSKFQDEQKMLFQTDMDVCKESTGINLEEWHRENGVKEAPDDNILSNFAFAQEAIAMANSQPRRGRMKRLITELSTLRTSLPEGIYICHGSSRLDILKVLIMGPKGTPYEHGFFQFDLFCPADYPNSPPRMSFKNTGSGGVRFNPNLYEDGKICLSLLGTWSGEPWNANHSTILQVLVSIQSMILCQEPWYNEPGREMTKSNSMSTRYNNQIRAYTIDIVIRPWVNSLSARNTLPATGPVSPSSRIWEETVRLYLKANGKDICKAYSDAATQSRNTNLQSSVANLKESLKNQGYLD